MGEGGIDLVLALVNLDTLFTLRWDVHLGETKWAVWRERVSGINAVLAGEPAHLTEGFVEFLAIHGGGGPVTVCFTAVNVVTVVAQVDPAETINTLVEFKHVDIGLAEESPPVHMLPAPKQQSEKSPLGAGLLGFNLVSFHL